MYGIMAWRVGPATEAPVSPGEASERAMDVHPAALPWNNPAPVLFRLTGGSVAAEAGFRAGSGPKVEKKATSGA